MELLQLARALLEFQRVVCSMRLRSAWPLHLALLVVARSVTARAMQGVGSSSRAARNELIRLLCVSGRQQRRPARRAGRNGQAGRQGALSGPPRARQAASSGTWSRRWPARRTRRWSARSRSRPARPRCRTRRRWRPARARSAAAARAGPARTPTSPRAAGAASAGWGRVSATVAGVGPARQG
jgi:hypothetical protein